MEKKNSKINIMAGKSITLCILIACLSILNVQGDDKAFLHEASNTWIKYGDENLGVPNCVECLHKNNQT